MRAPFCTLGANMSKNSFFENRPSDRCFCCRGGYRPGGSGVRDIASKLGWATWSSTL